MMDSSIQQVHELCEICDKDSIGFNFGVRTCAPCKAFFRRNAFQFNNHKFICPNNGNCVLSRQIHPVCKYCRLAKCFRVGMKKELILSESEKEQRRQTIERNRQKNQAKKLKSIKLDLVQPSRLFSKQSCTSLCLSSFDSIFLSNVFNAYESSYQSMKCSSNLHFPSVLHTSLHTYLNEYSISHKSLIEYLKHIPEFNKILIQDKIRLLRNHFGFINNINEAIIHPGITTNLIISLSNIFGVYLANRLLQCIERIQLFASDAIILKLLLIVCTLSSGNHRNCNDNDIDQICDDTLSIFTAQNIYVDLLWKYILSRSSTEMNAVKLFDKLIQFILYLLDVHLLVDGYINNLPNEINQMDLLMQSMWPKPNNNEIS